MYNIHRHIKKKYTSTYKKGKTIAYYICRSGERYRYVRAYVWHIEENESAARKSSVRWMQPYVVAVLINAVANPPRRRIFHSFFFFCSSSIETSPISLFLISLANSSRITRTRQNPSLGLRKLGKTAENAGNSAGASRRLKTRRRRIRRTRQHFLSHSQTCRKKRG